MKRLIYGLSMLSLLTFGSFDDLRAQEQEHEQEQTVKVKRGMRKSTKGAVVGGAAGAVGGVIVGHGVAGGVVGAGAGYLIGRHKEKKYGAYRPVKKVKVKDAD